MIEHNLVPKHELLSPEEAQKILDKYNVTRAQMPLILTTDSAIAHLQAQVGDIIKIIRKSRQIGDSLYYRVVVE